MSGASPPLVQLDGFEGPIDLLLELARQQRVDLSRISILALADQLIAVMTKAGRPVPLERQGEWLVIVAWLVLLKSRLLLPIGTAEAEEAERNAAAELRRFEEQVMMRVAASWLAARPQLGQQIFTRDAPPTNQVPGIGFAALLEAGLIVFRRAPTRAEDDAIYRPMPLLLWRVVDAIERMRTWRLGALSEDTPLTAFLPEMSPEEAKQPLLARSGIASTLVAGLELAREGVLTLDQEMPFGSILVRSSVATAPVT